MSLWSRKINPRRKPARNIVMIGLFLLFLLPGCTWGAPTPLPPRPPTPGIETILPAGKAEQVYVLPDGRRVLFREEPPGYKSPLMLLDVATGQEVLVSEEMDWAEWLDKELLYEHGTRVSGEDQYVVNLQPLAVVKLKWLPADAEALPGHVQEADDVYAIATGSREGSRVYTLLIVERDPSGNVTRGYVTTEVRNLDTLLGDIPYKKPPRHPYYNTNLSEYPSPDGQYYYTWVRGSSAKPDILQIYSQQGMLLNSVSASSSNWLLICHGWAWDSSGVYFQESRKVGFWGSPYEYSPLELLRVNP